MRLATKFSKDTYLYWYELMLLLRRFEEKTGQLYGMQKIRGFCHLYIGQEAVVDTDTFTLEGRDKKSLRNGLSGLAKKGFATKIFTAPLADDVVEKIKGIFFAMT